MRGLMTQVVLLRVGWGRRGGGDGDLDQFDGVDCLGGFVVTGLAAADVKESVVCLAPGLREFVTATLYCLMTSGFLALRGMTVWKAKRAWAIMVSLLKRISWSGEYGVIFWGMGKGFLDLLLLREGLALLKEIDPSALQRPPTGMPKVSLASLPESKLTCWARSGGRRPEGFGFGLFAVGVGGPDSKMQSESGCEMGWRRCSGTVGSSIPKRGSLSGTADVLVWIGGLYSPTKLWSLGGSS